MGHHLARRAALAVLLSLCFVSGLIGLAIAHPLGNFTVNQYARITVGADRATIRYVIDMAEISTLQELQKLDGAGDGAPSAAELDRHLQRIAAEYLGGLVLRVDDTRISLGIITKTISLAPGAGGLPTMRIVMDLAGPIPVAPGGSDAPGRLSFEDFNRRERLGWREIIVDSADGVGLFDSTAYGNGLTDELKAYPLEMLAAPLREEAASLSFRRGAAPAGVAALPTRDGQPVVQARDRLAELINVPEVTPLTALLGLVIAAGFGAVHAFSPGHGKTIVGAYLVGARASAKHAAFLGLTVTVTHTLGVLVLGLVTLFAAQYILPEQLYPVLSFVSGAMVLALGFSLFATRLRGALRPDLHGHGHAHPYGHQQDGTCCCSTRTNSGHAQPHGHQHDGTTFAHSHGGREHSHLPQGADGRPFQWRNLLALGVSGGLLPCPSALVVLLSAISLHRVGYGLLLVVAFSVGLAATLTGIGLAVVYAGRWMKRPMGPAVQRIVRYLPMASALVVAVIGAGICYEALVQAGFDIPGMLADFVARSGANLSGEVLALALAGVLAAVGLGLVFGLKHATAIDPVIAASRVANEHRNPGHDGHAHGSHPHVHGEGTRHSHAHVHFAAHHHGGDEQDHVHPDRESHRQGHAHRHGDCHDHTHRPVGDILSIETRILAKNDASAACIERAKT